MTLNSFWYAFLITLITLLISYPIAYILSQMKNQQFWLLLIILPIFNALEEMNPSLISASRDLGANSFETFRRVIFPLSLNGVKSGVQAVFIPSLSLFMLTRLIGGNRVITLGTAIEEYFMTTMNWSMGSTIGVVLIVLMVIVMLFTSSDHRRKKEIKL